MQLRLLDKRLSFGVLGVRFFHHLSRFIPWNFDSVGGNVQKFYRFGGNIGRTISGCFDLFMIRLDFFPFVQIGFETAFGGVPQNSVSAQAENFHIWRRP